MNRLVRERPYPLSNRNGPIFMLKQRSEKTNIQRPNIPTIPFSILASLSIALKIFDQSFNVLHWNGIVIAHADAANTSVTLQALKKKFLRSSQELLLLLVVPAVDSEADVHSASNRLVWNNTIHTRVLVEHAIDELSLLVCDFFLAPYFLCAKGIDKTAHNLSSDPEVEDWEGVVEGIVLCGRGIVEHDGARNTTEVQLPL